MSASCTPALAQRSQPSASRRSWTRGKISDCTALRRETMACWSWRDGRGPGASSAVRMSRSSRSASRSVRWSPCDSFSASSHERLQPDQVLLLLAGAGLAHRGVAGVDAALDAGEPGGRGSSSTMPATSAVHSRRNAFHRVRASGRSVADRTWSAPSSSCANRDIRSARASGVSSTSTRAGGGSGAASPASLGSAGAATGSPATASAASGWQRRLGLERRLGHGRRLAAQSPPRARARA